jgi:hypothetical protein
MLTGTPYRIADVSTDSVYIYVEKTNSSEDRDGFVWLPLQYIESSCYKKCWTAD